MNEDKQDEFELNGRGAKAIGVMTDDGFLVWKGS
jgi:hypothetical protein